MHVKAFIFPSTLWQHFLGSYRLCTIHVNLPYVVRYFFLFLVLLLLYVHGVRYKTGKVCYVLAVCIVRRVALHKHVLLGIVKLKQVVYMILFFPGQHCANIRRHPYRVIPHSIVCHTRDVYLSRSEYCSAPTPNQNNKHCSTSTRVDSVILNSISSAIVTPILKA